MLNFLLFFLFTANAYQIGTGIADMTGPSVEVNFMGYAAPDQTGRGIHLRLFSRAFIVDDGTKRIVFVSIDGGMGSDLLTEHVIQKVQKELGDQTYTKDNVCISGTHTHSGPAGFLQYTLFQFTSLGFVRETFDGFVTGISNSILRAHRNLQEGRIFLNQGQLLESNINRSPTSYLLNPKSERDQYPDGNTDKNMMLLKFQAVDGAELGVLNWFAVHGTSMNNTNKLISGDNRGYASQLLEKHVNGPTSKVRPGEGEFVAAFASTNLGDVSPNTKGPKCMDTGLPCDILTSTCNGKNEMCIASGPGKDMFESTKIIGTKQFERALSLMMNTTEEITGTVDFRHTFVKMPGLTVNLSDGSTGTLCTPSMGYAFAAGTTDGPGMFDFTQGTNSTNPFWNLVAGLLSKPTKEEIACQAPKPILLNTGDITKPYKWDPHTVPVQILRIGQVFILAVPVELTTMAGRRVRAALQKVLAPLVKQGNIYVTIAGLSNGYASYTTTYEEYQGQRYEAASTIFGPHELQAWIQELSRIGGDMVAGKASDSDPAPTDNLAHMVELLPDVIFDRAPIGKNYGDVLSDVVKSAKVGDIVSATFQAGNPRNDQKLDDTYLTVEQQVGSDWKVVAVDADWSTKFEWQIKSEMTGISHAHISWEVDQGMKGTFRLCHSGHHKSLFGSVKSYSGCSSTFTVQ